ncbi:MAG: PQQ-binding-like beta-propeller repeat protein [Solirubrobacteraceae bacterium]
MRGTFRTCVWLLACLALLAACGGRSTATQSGGVSSDNARPPRTVPDGDWTTFDYNSQRSGVGPAETGITAGDLGRLRRRVVQLDGTVDSSAIQLHGVSIRSRKRDVIVMSTTYGRTIALDPGTGAKLWEYTPDDISAYQGSAQVTTATPVADPSRRYVYAASPDGRIHKLALASGREVRSRGWPARVTFSPTREKIASAVNVSGNSLITVTGGYLGDTPPYQGHVVMIDRASGRITHVFNTLCSNRRQLIQPSSCGASDSAIWARAGAVIEPGTRRILLATGNAPFNGVTDWGDSVLELAPDASRLLHNWTPRNQAQLNTSDADLGSTAPALLPETHGLRLAVQGGKDGHLYLLNLNRLDGTGGAAGPRTGGELQEIPAPGGDQVFTAPAVWTHAGRTYVFVANGSGTAAYVLGGGGHPVLSVAWSNSTAGTSPVAAGGLLYVYDPADGSLVIRRPTNGAMLGSLAAAGGHWNSPIVLGGRIIVPVGNYQTHSTSGTVYIYHLPGR